MSLTPSERLLLSYATRDDGAPADAALVVREPNDAAVHELLAAALLASEQAGAATFESGSAKRLFGLRTVQVLRMQPTNGAASPWPAGTFEAHTLAAAHRLAAKGKHEVSEVTDEVITLDPNPEGDTVTRMLRPLMERGFVAEHTEKKTTLKVFKTTHRSYLLTTAGAAALQAAPASEVKALLETCRRDRPAVWSEIWKGVTETFSRKTQNDAGDFSGPD